MSNAYPKIYEAKYGDAENARLTAADASINSKMLGFLLRLVKPAFLGGPNFAEGNWTSLDWRVRIEGQHFGEEGPHYVLDVGFDADDTPEDFKSKAAVVHFDYCDNVSSDSLKIERETGVVTIWAYFSPHMPIADQYSDDYLVRQIGREFVEALNAALPNHAILFDTRQFV